jgi:hypothetical protein
MSDWITLDPKDEATFPTERGLYWWRLDMVAVIGSKNIDRPAWVEPASPHSNGVKDRREMLPDFAHWNGWEYKVPAGTQWRCVTGDEVEDEFHFQGVGVLPCPFCDCTPHMKWLERPAGGGAYVSQRIWKANFFQIQCFGCSIAATASPSIDGVLIKWNTRSSPDDREFVHPKTNNRKAFWR